MNTRFAQIVIAVVVALTVDGSLIAGLPNLDELAHAGPAINYYVIAARAWWTCKYDWTEVRRKGNTIVYGITFPGREKCSRSKRTEYFELFYDSTRHKVLKMVPAKGSS